ncbi:MULTISPECIES: TIGR03086 family metal-binding protein [unclassified Streptomyces]|uniref:TIGR03086 family metal-binding protein n=1 Tax=unclassified Streptomyces TaxID=2593676 RepID=UPI002E2A4549|nr:TIGR03086 family metal-binding protein [Streptomyces sp. NBC_01423]WSX94181.1 TIGR03086 family metal-binding protein [Streptomyces sp. NBC_00891]WSY08658.1 TIGR03086 family metal-binding protein [Streptomyces sp. NBC_00890]WSZ10281.1 TIGR03086 family metal-binding protein [Streptomyces sp. NBC_00869]WSZ22216.1 TIGR03086 family metal-binding protein [Streptomyces sp. NBC_00870]
MDTQPLDLEPAARRITAQLDAVDDAALGAATPCPGVTVGALLAHVEGLAVAFRDAARKDLGATTDSAPSVESGVLEPGWRTTLPAALDEMVAAWRSPDAWEGMTRAGSVDLPGQVAGMVALNELVLHGWDLAKATGQPFDAEDAHLRSSLALLAELGDNPPATSPFGPPVPVPEDAPLLDRAVARGGRRPDWRPAG